MKVYREGKEIFEIKDYKQVGSFMNVAYIDATVKSPTPFIFQIGDYVIFDYNGLTYTLYDVAPEKKQARSGTYGEAFIYELRFKADTEQLVICPFLDLVPNDNNLTYTSLPSFSTFENVYGIAARLQANMDYLYPNKWRFDVVDTTDESLLELLSEMREFSISGESCFDGLKKIYDTWGVSFIHTYEDGINVITIGKSAGTTSVFRYGKGQGLRTIKKNIQNSSELCTRAYVYGSTRNIPALWYNEKGYIGEAQYAPNLMIPPSKWVGGIPQGAYIDAIFDLKVGDTILTDADNRIEKYGLRIKTLSYDGSDSSKDEIYPSIEKVTAYDIRKAKEELGQETYIPSSRYPNNDRMDYILEGTTIEDDGIGTDAGYVIYSDKIASDIQKQTRQFEIAERLSEDKYKLLTLQQSITLCSFNVTKTAWYRISEVLDVVKFKKNDLESTISATIILQKPSGDYIELRKLSFTDKLEASMQLPETGGIKVDEVGKYTVILKFNVSWDTDYVSPQIGEDVTLDCIIKGAPVTFSRGHNILATFFDIKIKQIGFNLNDVTASGLTKTIHIKSGMCAGRTFNITQCKYSESDDSWILTCKRIDDNAISQRFPNSIFPIAKDDQFILLNIHMPDIYIHTAMQRLYNTAIEDLKHLSKPQYVIEPEIDNLQMARSPQIIKEGMYMPIEDTDISFIDDTLIDSVTITNKEKELRSFQVTLRSDKIINTFSKLASRISDLENSLADTEAKSNISQAQDEDNTKINEGNAGLDESALAQYLEDNDYATITDVEEIVEPVSDKVDDVEKELSALGLSVKEINGKKYLESAYDFVTLGAISFGGKGESGGGGGGATALNDLTDVTLGTLVNGQALVWDATQLKWVNKNISGGTADSIAWDAITGKPSLAYYDTRIDTNTLANSVNKIGYGYATEGWYESGPALSFGVENYQFQMQMRLSAEISSVVWRPVQSGTKFTWRHFLDAYNYSNYALPLSGGTIKGTTETPLFVDTSYTQSRITFQVNGTNKSLVGYNPSYGAWMYNFVCKKFIGLKDDGTPFYYDTAERTLIHSGNYSSYALPLSGGTMVSGAGIYSHLDSVYGAIAFNKDHNAFGSPNVPTKIRSNVTPIYSNGTNEYTMLHSGNYSSYALPLSGGTINGSTAYILKINRTVDNPVIAYYANNSLVGFLGISTTGSPIYITNAGNTRDLIHSGNIGSQSVDNSAKLAGVSGGQYLYGDFMGAYDANTIYDFIYKSVAGGSNLPSAVQYGSLLTLPYRQAKGNTIPDFAAQIYIPNGDDSKPYMWFRTSLRNTWNSWRKVVSEEANGNVLIGTTEDNGHKLNVEGSISANGGIYVRKTGAVLGIDIGAARSPLRMFNFPDHDCIYFQINKADGSGTSGKLFITGHGGYNNYFSEMRVYAPLNIYGNLTATGSITFGSDVRYKNILKDVEIDLETIANAPLFNYKWIDSQDDRTHLGTTAQYWNNTAFKNAVIPTNDATKWTMSYSEIAMGNTIVIARELLTVKQNHETRLERAERKIKELENELKQYRRA